MKKAGSSLCLLILVLLLVAGCANKITESNIKKSDSDIVEIAYQYLDERTKKTIVNWKDAEVEEDDHSRTYLVAGPNGVVSTEGKNAYMVTFHTNNDVALGPISVFIDKNTDELIGVGLRD